MLDDRPVVAFKLSCILTYQHKDYRWPDFLVAMVTLMIEHVLERLGQTRKDIYGSGLVVVLRVVSKRTRTLLKLVQPQVDDQENKGMESTKWCVKEVARIPPMTRTRNAWCMFARIVSQQSPNLSCKNLRTAKQSVVNACCTQ